MIRRLSIPKLSLGPLAALLVCIGAADADAQLKGVYIPGSTGLQSGTQPPPGVYFANVTFIYPTDTLKNDSGDKILSNVSLVSFLEGPGISWVANAKIAGGTVGGSAIFPFARNQITAFSLDRSGSLRYSDTLITPIQIGWHFKKSDL